MNNATKATRKSPQTEKHLSGDHRLRSPGADQDCTNPYSSDVREAVSLFGSSPSVPPPLCSLCRHKAPVFGKPPRRFTYRQLEVATDGFADATFVAEGGGGRVHRGILEDGRVVAVKRLKAASCGKAAAAEEEEEFCEEVEVLSRAQHRNVVMLVGFCVEGAMKVLVYEYICNGSLDLHLYGTYLSLGFGVALARRLRLTFVACRASTASIGLDRKDEDGGGRGERVEIPA